MHRLFVALRPSAAAQATLLDTMDGVPGARWQTDDQLHLTLRFCGELDRHQASDPADMLARITAPPVAVRVAGTGAFARRGKVHTLWAGVRPGPALLRLQGSVDRAAASAGLAASHRTYRPHITLARLSTRGEGVEAWLARTAGLSLPMEMADTMILFESMLGGEGAHYRIVERFRLGGRAS